MQNFQYAVAADEALPPDEIDELFEKLLPVQPPPGLIQRILHSVSQLPKPQTPKQESEDELLDRLVVRKEMLPPS